MSNITRRRLLASTTAVSAMIAINASTPLTALASAAKTFTTGSRKFDVIIVGGGSAGAVMAARLSEKSDRNVLLLEAGHSYAPYDYPKLISDSDVVGANANPEFEWGFKTTPGYVGHPINALRGKVLGGSSGINGAVAIRARPEDFKRWNLPGWSFEDLMPSFKKLEHRHGQFDPALHGVSGPLPVVQLTRDDVSPMQRAFMDASIANGYKAVAGFDGKDAEGVSPYAMNVVNGVRVNTGMAYLTEEVRKRSNLTIIPDTLVDRVLFEGKRAIGVRLAKGEEIHGGEVILSAGSYGSATILLRSGIGPAADSERLSIPVVADLPVGTNLVDHPFYYTSYAAKPEAMGALTPVIGAKLFTHSSGAKNGELDLHITAIHLFPADMSPTKVGFILAVALVRPHSKGHIKLTSRDPLAKPEIDLNFLAEEADRKNLMEGIQLARKIGRTAPLSGFVHSELAPASDKEEDILASMKETLDTYHHPCSTAPMGLPEDKNAVVNMQGQVYGLQGLRVVDASIFPDVPSVATNITTIAAAEHIARHYA